MQKQAKRSEADRCPMCGGGPHDILYLSSGRLLLKGEPIPAGTRVECQRCGYRWLPNRELVKTLELYQ